jgi:hypothetical protein
VQLEKSEVLSALVKLWVDGNWHGNKEAKLNRDQASSMLLQAIERKVMRLEVDYKGTSETIEKFNKIGLQIYNVSTKKWFTYGKTIEL